jgi:hypothetical protein
MSTRIALRTIARLAAAAVISGPLVVGLAAPASAATPLAGAAYCGNIDLEFRDRSAFPAGARGDAQFKTQSSQLNVAVECLVNAERTALGIHKLGKAIGVRNDAARNRAINGLSAAAAEHARDAVSIRWWGKVEPGKTCRPFTAADRPDLCDPHLNPLTGSTPESRLRATGWTAGCSSHRFSENTYTGAGPGSATPRAAVTFWKESKGHMANILDPNMWGVGTSVVRGSADSATGSTAPAATYVQMFGVCNR